MEWGGHADVGPLLQGVGTIYLALWIEDVSDEYLHWQGAGRLPTQGGPPNDGEETSKIT